jgi:hypothetical protein
MTPTPFRCNKKAYVDHYGHGLRTFVAEPQQYGTGLGNFLGGLFRRMVPLFSRHIAPTLKSVAIKTGKNFLRSGAQIAKDVFIEKKNIKDSAKRRVKSGLHNLVEEVANQSGRGRKRGITNRPSACKKPAKRRRRTAGTSGTDIFD